MDDSAARVRVLVVDDDLDLAKVTKRILVGDGYDVEHAEDPRAVLARLDAGDDPWHVVLLDIGLPVMSGIDVLRRFREAHSLASIVMLTGDETASTATTCMRAGAFYYLTKPFKPFVLSAMVESAVRHSTLCRELAGVRQEIEGSAEKLLIGGSPAMRKLRAQLDLLASKDASVLVLGESGTGKELVARALHYRGERRKSRFIALNCGAIPKGLIDSELFGHKRGSFTSASSDRAGVFEEADGGTLFLDEIGDMPLDAQPHLLRVLQESEVRRVGDSVLRKVNVRLIAATHVDLAARVEQGLFRQDLFFRLNVVILTVPPLRERPDDLPILAAHFLSKHGGASPMTISPEALDVMMSYRWPGNVRELENALQSAVALRQGDVITPESLPSTILHSAGRGASLRQPPAIPAASGVMSGDSLVPLTEAGRTAAAAFQKQYLIVAMERAKGSVAESARLAGVDRTNFRRLLQRHGIDPNKFKP
jgi:DNA-binding NtrC family response regulator